jgi:hypothetical protein
MRKKEVTPMQRKARNLIRGDVFRLHVYGEVLTAIPVANSKRVKVKLALENQGRRVNRGNPTQSDKPSELEFLDTGHVLEFVCPPGRVFHLIERDDDDDDDGDEEVVSPDDDGDEEVVSPSPVLTDAS